MDLENLDQNFNQLLFKCIEGSASESEMKEAWDWIAKSVENKKYYESIRDIWLSMFFSKPMEEKQLEDFWQKFKTKNRISINNEKAEEQSETKGVFQRFIRVAAIIIIAFSLGAVLGKVYFKKEVPAQSNEFYIVEAPRGAKSFVTLADGTKIWLNAGSKISYQRNFNQANRNVFLEGEAFFVVAKNQ